MTTQPFTGLLSLYLAEQSRLVDLGLLSDATLKTIRNRYTVIYRYLEEFKCSEILSSSFDARQCTVLCNWMKQNKYSHSYTAKVISLISTVHTFGYLYHGCDLNPLQGFRLRSQQRKPPVFLLPHEVNRLKVTDWPKKRLYKTADLFRFQCYTGLGFSDLESFSFKEHCIKINGKYFIDSSRIKTGISFIVPLLSEAYEILEKYSFELPRICNQKYNEHLKEIAAAAKLDKRLTTHVGRKTCGYYFLNAGMTIESVSKILGHSSTQITQRIYAQVVHGRFIGELEKLPALRLAC